jgi:hypothetical protein
MLRLTSKITITGLTDTYVFDFVTDLSITRTWDNLTQSGKMTLPQKIVWKNKEFIRGDNPIVKRGNAIKIELGYNGVLNTYFDGFISKVIPARPVQIEFEDYMWVLKQATVNKYSKSNLTLNQLLSDLVTGIPFVAADVNIGTFQADKVNVVQVLDYIKQNYGLISYIRNGTLYCGLAYWLSDDAFGSGGLLKEADRPRTFERIFTQNIIDSKLEYNRLDDQKIQVKAVNINDDNSRNELTVGDADGDVRTIFQYNVSEDELRKVALNYLDKFRFEGYTGSFTTFGDQFCDHGDTVRIVDPIIPDRNGDYLVKKVETTFGTSGFRNEIELDGQA